MVRRRTCQSRSCQSRSCQRRSCQRHSCQSRSGTRPFPGRGPWWKYGAALLVVAGLMPAGPALAAATQPGSAQQAHGSASQDNTPGQTPGSGSHTQGSGTQAASGGGSGHQGAAHHAGQKQASTQASKQPATPQARARAEAIGRTGTEAPVGLPPGPRGAGAMSENPTPHAEPGKRIIPGPENPAGPASPTRTTSTGAPTANLAATGSVGGGPSRRDVTLPGARGTAETGPGTKLNRQARPLPKVQSSREPGNGYNPAEIAPIDQSGQAGQAGQAGTRHGNQAEGYNPAQVHGVNKGG